MTCRRCGGFGQLWYPVAGCSYTRNDWCDQCGGTGDETRVDEGRKKVVSARLRTGQYGDRVENESCSGELFPPEWSPEELTLS
jgi:hypothetical protein